MAPIVRSETVYEEVLPNRGVEDTELGVEKY